MKPPIILLFAAMALCGCNKPAPAVWEYEQVNWGADFSSVVIQIDTQAATPPEKVTCLSTDDLLDAMGKRRWELVTVTAGPRGAVYYFKRPRSSVSETYLFDDHYKAAASASK